MSMLRKAVGIISILTLCLLAVPLAADAQQPRKVYRIGYLSVSTGGYETNPQHCPIKGTPTWQAMVEGLRERGYIPGQNLVIECRYTEGREERAPALAAELVSLKPDLLVVYGTVQVRAAKQATSTIPIVMLGVMDPVGRGLVASLAQPGGNVTGLADTPMEMEGKRLQLLKEAVPKVSRVAVLSHPGSTPDPLSHQQREIEAAAQALHVTLQKYDIRDPTEFTGAFAAMTKARAEALFVKSDPFWAGHGQRIAEFAAQNRLPAVSPGRNFVEAGGLMSYDVNDFAIRRRVGVYVDKIFKGAKPGELPVEQPTKFELVINLKTAKALGLTIPPSLLMRADEVIQ
jgi:putative ABC transport system substrate-binding protein